MIETLDRVVFLKGIDIFSEIPSEFLVHVAQLASEVLFAPGDAIMSEGETGDCLFVIVEGEVEVRVSGRCVATLRARECVGEMSLLDAEPLCASVVASSELITLRIGQEEFYDLLAEHAEIARGVIALLTRRLRTAIVSQPSDKMSLRP